MDDVDDPRVGAADPELRTALTRKLKGRAVVNAEITVPAAPAMLEEYVAMCTEAFEAIGVYFNEADTAHLRTVLESQLAEAYAASPRSNIVINYQSPVGTTVSYTVKAQWTTLEGAYDNWVATREPPLFGTEPDARVLALAAEAADPAAFPILDIGAGTGRNCLALARRGHPVDAVEMSPKFAEIIVAQAHQEGLGVRVTLRDVFTTTSDLRRDYQLILLSEVVSDFRSVEQLAGVFALASECLAPGGRLVFNIFVARDGYEPDAAARELGQQCYTSIFTRAELAAASGMSGLELVSDDQVHDYEKEHLPEGSWPPTSWYADWVSGLDVFGVPREECPIEMRWLVYRKAEWIMAPSGRGAGPADW